MTLVIGVDPGKTGAIARWDSDDRSLTVADMPLSDKKLCVEELSFCVKTLISSCKALPIVYIEKVGGIGTQSAARSFEFGFVTGAVHGVMSANGLNLKTVTPQKWKAAMGLKREIGESNAEFKTRSRILAAELFPEGADMFKRAKDDGRAEAFLIAYYGAAIENGHQ